MTERDKHETIWTDSNRMRLMPTTFLRHNCSNKQMRWTGVHASLVPVASVEECTTKCQPTTALDRTETFRRIKVWYRIPADPRRGHIRNMATYVRWMGVRSNHSARPISTQRTPCSRLVPHAQHGWISRWFARKSSIAEGCSLLSDNKPVDSLLIMRILEQHRNRLWCGLRRNAFS